MPMPANVTARCLDATLDALDAELQTAPLPATVAARLIGLVTEARADALELTQGTLPPRREGWSSPAQTSGRGRLVARAEPGTNVVRLVPA